VEVKVMSKPSLDTNQTTRNRAKLRRAWLLVGLAPGLLASCTGIPGRGEKEIRYEMTHRFTVEDPQFLRSMGQLLGPAIVPGNRVTALQNGDQIFPAMLGAISSAQQSIVFETYIYWSGDIGQKFSDALCERAQAGVKVHVMLDWLGAGKIDGKYLAAMKAAGVEVERYHPLHWYNLSRLNNRTHRKLLVVDGRIGFTGGVGIADAWEGDGTAKDHWRDTH
jgi:cardiolipin synthase